MQRNIAIFLLVALSFIAAFLYYTKGEILFSKENSVFKAVPVSAPFFVQVKSLQSVPLENPMVKELIDSGFGKSHFEWLEKLNSLILSREDYEDTINEPFVVVFNLTGNGGLTPLLIKQVNSNNSKRKIAELIQTVYPENNKTRTERNYSGCKLESIITSDNQVISYCFADGLLLIGSDEQIVEQAIKQLNSANILEDNSFEKVGKTAAGQSTISWYINHRFFNDVIQNILADSSLEYTNEFGENVKRDYGETLFGLENYASWTEFDTEIKNDKIALNGISVAEDSLNQFLSVFDGQQPVKIQADEVLPKDISFYYGYSFSDKNKFFENLDNYYKNSRNNITRDEFFNRAGLEFKGDLKSVLQQIVKDEMVISYSSVEAHPGNNSAYFIMDTEGKSLAEEQLSTLLSRYAEAKGVDANSLKIIYPIDNETKFTIYNFPFPSFPGVWLGAPFSGVNANYITFYENFMVFCSSESGLKDYLHNMVLDAKLAKDSRYLDIREDLFNRTNINVYVNVDGLSGLYEEIFNSEITKRILENEQSIKRLGILTWQVLHEKNYFFNSIVLNYNSGTREEAKTVWQSNIGNKVASRPRIVVNHDDLANREIIFQDNKNNLIQVTNQGRVRWNIQIAEPIMGEILQVDNFRNGKLQYLFNTKSKLYLVDRDGNNVDPFPITFRSPATNGVNVFDYDNNRNYRFFVACEDKKVYVYESSGKIVEGWNFGKTDFIVTTPVQHFRVGNKDYIAFKDKSRIYIQDRQGRNRIKSPVSFENSKNPIVLNLDGKPKIVADDISGNVYYLFFDGKYEKKKTANFSEKHFFTVDDLNGNGIPDFVFADGNDLFVTVENGKELFSKKFKNAIGYKPCIYNLGTNLKKIGVVDSDAKRIYLFSPDGKLHEGFPLQGDSEFTIGRIAVSSPGLNILVGSQDGELYNYLLN